MEIPARMMRLRLAEVAVGAREALAA
jgi:hypothetical protein